MANIKSGAAMNSRERRSEAGPISSNHEDLATDCVFSRWIGSSRAYTRPSPGRVCGSLLLSITPDPLAFSVPRSSVPPQCCRLWSSGLQLAGIAGGPPTLLRTERYGQPRYCISVSTIRTLDDTSILASRIWALVNVSVSSYPTYHLSSASTFDNT
jgi:hypothetical protein